MENLSAFNVRLCLVGKTELSAISMTALIGVGIGALPHSLLKRAAKIT
jgi:hypothetical protein